MSAFMRLKQTTTTPVFDVRLRRTPAAMSRYGQVKQRTKPRHGDTSSNNTGCYILTE